MCLVTHQIASFNKFLMILRVILSKNDKYAVGDLVNAMFGWSTHAICDDSKAEAVRLFKVDTSVPEDRLSYALGTLGMPG